MAATTTGFSSLQLLNQNLNPNYVDYDQLLSFHTQQDELASLLGLDYYLAMDDPNPLLLSHTFFNGQNDHEFEFRKRRKTREQFQSSFNGFEPIPSLVQPLEFPQLYANEEKVKAGNNGGASLSPQSIAARERRRRITEKTNELGKLVPLGSKMNTAEMFQAAYKYIKFLQVQVAMLKLMDSLEENKDQQLWNGEGFQVLASPIVQEKCLVSRRFVETLAKDQDFQSKPFLKDNIAKLL